MSHRIEITKEMLEKYISDSYMEFTLEEVEALMDSEVEKPEDEMDTELVDMCAAILAKAYNPDFKEGRPAEIYRPWEDKNKNGAESTEAAKPDKKKVIPLKRILLVAAVLVAVLAVALTAGANLFDNKVSDGIINFYSDFFKIDLKKDEPTTVAQNDAVNDIDVSNLDGFILPEVLRGEEYEKSAQLVQDGNITTVLIRISNPDNGINGDIMITRFNNADHDMTNGQVNVSDVHRTFKQLTVDGKEIIIFGMDEKSYINYSDGTTNYEIALDCDFDTMVSIAETINVKG